MWDELSMKDRAKYIKLGVSSGVTSLDTIRKVYNKYAEGGGLNTANDEDPGTPHSPYIENPKPIVSSEFLPIINRLAPESFIKQNLPIKWEELSQEEQDKWYKDDLKYTLQNIINNRHHQDLINRSRETSSTFKSRNTPRKSKIRTNNFLSRAATLIGDSLNADVELAESMAMRKEGLIEKNLEKEKERKEDFYPYKLGIDSMLAASQLLSGIGSFGFRAANRYGVNIPRGLEILQPITSIGSTVVDGVQLATSEKPLDYALNVAQTGTGLLGLAGEYDLLYKIPQARRYSRIIDPILDYTGIANSIWDIGEGISILSTTDNTDNSNSTYANGGPLKGPTYNKSKRRWYNSKGQELRLGDRYYHKDNNGGHYLDIINL